MALVAVIGPTIRAGQSLSEGLDLSNGDLLRLTMPLDWTPAPISFQISTDGGTYNDVFRLDGTEVTLPVVIPRTAIIVPADIGKAIAWIKFRSGWRGNPIPQQADRTFAVAVSTYTGKPSG